MRGPWSSGSNSLVNPISTQHLFLQQRVRVRHSAKRDEVIPSPSSKVPGLGCWSERKCGVLRNELFRRKIFVRSTLRGRGQDEAGHEIRSKEAFMSGGERLFRRGPQVNVLRYSHSATACLSCCRLGCSGTIGVAANCLGSLVMQRHYDNVTSRIRMHGHSNGNRWLQLRSTRLLVERRPHTPKLRIFSSMSSSTKFASF